MSTTSKTALKQVFLFAITLVLLDQSAGFALRRLYAHTFDGDTAGMINQALAKRDADVLVFGSSRASHHVASPQLSQALGRPVVNVGVDGQSVLYARALQSEMLRRGTKAKVFVLQVDAADIFSPDAGHLAVVTPLAAHNSTVLSLLERGDPYLRVKLLSATYPFNSKVLSLLANVGKSPAPDQWRPLPAKTGPVLAARSHQDAADATTKPLDPAGISALRGFIAAARSAKIAVLIFCGPKLRTGGPGVLGRRAQAIFAKLAEQEGVSFAALDEVTHPVFQDGKLYRDVSHLNRMGAALLTKLLAAELTRLLDTPRAPGQPR